MREGGREGGREGEGGEGRREGGRGREPLNDHPNQVPQKTFDTVKRVLRVSHAHSAIQPFAIHPL